MGGCFVLFGLVMVYSEAYGNASWNRWTETMKTVRGGNALDLKFISFFLSLIFFSAWLLAFMVANWMYGWTKGRRAKIDGPLSFLPVVEEEQKKKTSRNTTFQQTLRPCSFTFDSVLLFVMVGIDI